LSDPARMEYRLEYREKEISRTGELAKKDLV
jgi:hypothetical protein